MSQLQPSPSPVDIRVSILVGKAKNDVIGHQNSIPWHLSEDMKHFKATTLGHTIIMGRKTYESIGKPLPGRRTIVVSRNPGLRIEGVTPSTSLGEAIALAGEAPNIFVVGGAGIFREAMAVANRLIVTEIDLEPPGNVLFPPIDPTLWRKIPGKPQTGSNGIGFTISIFERRIG